MNVPPALASVLLALALVRCSAQESPAATTLSPAQLRDVLDHGAPAGTQPFASGPFAARVAHPRVLRESGLYIARVLGDDPMQLGILQFAIATSGPTDGSVPVYVAHQSDPHYTIHCKYYSHCPIEGADVAIPKGARPGFNFGDKHFTDDGAHDRHLAVRNLDTHVETDLWLAPEPSDEGGSLEVGFGGSYPFASGGFDRPGSATAAGFALTQGRIRPVDLIAGRIPYALFFVAPCENGHVAPANGDDGAHDAGCPPLGSRVWLDSTPDEIDASGAPRDVRVILRALHDYGGYIGDRCGGRCTLNLQLEGGLSYTAFGLANPWSEIAAHFPDERTSGPQHEYHIPVRTGTIDLRKHLHVIAYP